MLRVAQVFIDGEIYELLEGDPVGFTDGQLAVLVSATASLPRRRRPVVKPSLFLK